MKKMIMILALMVFISSNIFGVSLLNTMAKEPSRPEQVSYYKSIQIKSGDSLWSIASEYTKDTDIKIQDYIHQLMQMNGLKEETIHAGQYLTVMYMVDAES